MDGWRSTSTDHVAKLRQPRVLTELPDRERAIVEHLERNGASFFAAMHEAAGGGYPGDTRRRHLDTRVGWCHHERQPERRAGVHASTRAPQPQDTNATAAERARPHRTLPQPADGAADRRRPLVADDRSCRRDSVCDGICDRARAAVAHPLRRADPRGRDSRRHHRWLQRGLRRPQGARGCRTDPARLLRERRRRDAVRAARGARPAQIAQGRARRGGSRRAGGHRSGKPVRHDPALA